MAGNMLNKGVSNWNPDLSPTDTVTKKLMTPNAVEKPDNVTGTNELKQVEMPSSRKAYGTLGRRGHGF